MIAIIIIILAIALDQLTKYWAFVTLNPTGDIGLIKGVLHLSYAENTGAAFSILQNQRWIFISITIIAIIALCYLLITKRITDKIAIISAAMIIGGGIGNLIDRILKGYVIDFIDFRLINFAVFNVADSFVCVGAVIGAIWYLFFYDKKQESK